jgi:hypothetical protein
VGYCQPDDWYSCFPWIILAQQWRNSGQAMILIGFRFTENNIRGQEFCFQWQILSRERFVWQLLFSFSETLPDWISHHSEWIGRNTKTRIHLLWRRAKIVQTHHFSEHSKVPPKFRISTVSDCRIVKCCEGSNASQRCRPIPVVSPTDNSRVSLSLGGLHDPSISLSAGNPRGIHNFRYDR